MSTLEMLTPGQLVIKAQVRTDAKADKALIADVKANGILQPITAYRDADANTVVLAGHRRTLAAIAAGLDEVPVYLVPEPTEEQRIVSQVAENERREALTGQDLTAALFDLTQHASDAAVAKKMHVSRAHVATVKAVMANEVAANHFQESMNLEEASVLAEFADDADALERINNRDSWTSIKHVAERIRQDHAADAAIQAASLAHIEAGRTIITDSAEVNSSYSVPEAALAVRVDQVNRPDGTEATEADANAVLLTARHYDGAVSETLLITGWVEAGYTDRTGRTAKPLPTTEEEEAAAAEAKAARRRVLANNKAMDAAQVVRRDWLTQFLTRKTLPKDAPMFVARAISQGNTTDPKAQDMATGLMGLTFKGYRSIRSNFDDLAKRPEVITLALSIATIEGHLDKTAWREPAEPVRAYFAQLITWGYEASEVEAEAAAKRP